MVRAILAGTKTQTRRVVKQQPPADKQRSAWYEPGVMGWAPPEVPSQHWHRVRCPYGQPGDRLWVRETWRVGRKHDHVKPIDLPYDRGLTTFYDAGGSRGRQEIGGPYVNDDKYPAGAMPEWVGKGRPSIHMPRVASRITLELTGVRVERLQDVSETDLHCEGLQETIDAGIDHDGTPRDAWRALWSSINGAESWRANPWVWVVEFRRLEQPR